MVRTPPTIPAFNCRVHISMALGSYGSGKSPYPAFQAAFMTLLTLNAGIFLDGSLGEATVAQLERLSRQFSPSNCML